MKSTILFTLFIGLVLIQSCDGYNKPVEQEMTLRSGSWNLDFRREDGLINARMNLMGEKVEIINAEETIESKISFFNTDSFEILIPVFGTRLQGKILADSIMEGFWIPPGRADSLGLSFRATFRSENTFQQTQTSRDTLVYAVSFSKGTRDEYLGVALFREQGQMICGTFLTETGDYRFLHGERNDDSLWLSCFDGSHLFLFNGYYHGTDSISGTFKSGKNWKEPWAAKLNKKARLSHPDSLTLFTDNPDSPLEFQAITKEGKPVKFGKDNWEDHVTIVQIYGSWCPNCMDESRYYAELHQKFAERGVQIIPVAFERYPELKDKVTALNKFEDATGLTVESYIGGNANKGEASLVFNQLSKVISFPTSIIIDKKGRVRKVHTGFYGPGTGKYYDRYTGAMDSFIEALINE